MDLDREQFKDYARGRYLSMNQEKWGAMKLEDINKFADGAEMAFDIYDSKLKELSQKLHSHNLVTETIDDDAVEYSQPTDRELQEMETRTMPESRL